MMVTRVGEEVIKKAIMDAGAFPNDGQAFQRLLRAASGHGSIEGLGFRMDLGRPIIGIGAPAIDFIKPLEKRLSSPVIVPEGHEVGNAVGAVSSYVSETFIVQGHLLRRQVRGPCPHVLALAVLAFRRGHVLGPLLWQQGGEGTSGPR